MKQEMHFGLTMEFYLNLTQILHTSWKTVNRKSVDNVLLIFHVM